MPKPEVKPKPEQKPIKEPEIKSEPERVEEPPVSASKIDVIKAQYIEELKKAIEDKKYYPKRAKRLKHEGIVQVCFTVLKDGSIKNVTVLRPSKYKRLNKGALQTLQKVDRFAPIPKELKLDQWEIVVPIEYILR
jgi:protein TonB